MKPSPADDYRCFEKEAKKEINVYGAVTPALRVRGVGGLYNKVLCTKEYDDCAGDTEPTTPLDDCVPAPVANWCLLSDKVTESKYIRYDPVDGYPEDECTTWAQATKWHRETAEGTCNAGVATPPTYASGWNLITDDCAGSGVSTWWRCPGSEEMAGDYGNASTLGNFINTILTQMGCGLTVKSDFFDINTVGDAPANDAYAYAAANLQHITVHQKSDIKSKGDADSTAPSWVLKMNEWLNDLRRLFNVYYIIENGVLIIEHYTFFTSVLGLDISDRKTERLVDYAGGNKVGSELFYYMDEDCSEDFAAKPILYDCGEEEKEQRCLLISTDLVYIENEDNAEKISDEGFVLIANERNGTDYIIMNNNEPLRWGNLLGNLHKEGRLYKSGTLNEVHQDFENWRPYISQKDVEAKKCNCTGFNANDKVKTDYGTGEISTAKYNVYTGKMKLDIKY